MNPENEIRTEELIAETEESEVTEVKTEESKTVETEAETPEAETAEEPEAVETEIETPEPEATETVTVAEAEELIAKLEEEAAAGQERPDRKKSKRGKKVKKGKRSRRSALLADKKTGRGRRKREKGLLPLFLMSAAVLSVAGFVVWIMFFFHEAEPVAELETAIEQAVIEIADTAEQEEEQGVIGKGILEHIITAANAVEEAFSLRPKEYLLTDEDREDFMGLDCRIAAGTGKVVVSAKAEGIARSDDKFYYLFAINMFENTIPEDAEFLDKQYKNDHLELSASLNYNQASSRLFKKFVVAIKQDGEYLPVSRGHFITNPEAIAKYAVYQQPASKKGLLVDPNKLRGNELDDLGVKQAAYNIPVQRILGPTSNPAYPTIYYNYGGKTYTFNGQTIAEYDIVFGTLTSKGICTTAIILNSYSGAYLSLIHPSARAAGAAPYYMFNGAEETGIEYMAAIATFLAERYSGTAHGKISNWVIANEINARKEWNYMPRLDVESYVEEYARGFRVFYNAVKSVNASARIYMPIDQQWDRNLNNNPDYDGRDILDAFARNIKASGDIDWGLAQHPYNVPLTEPRIWKATKYVTHSATSSMMSMQNIEVLTDYMQQDYLLAPDGSVRSIILSEQGYTSTHGEALQAAAFAYAYYKVANNPYIDAFLLNRETDAPEEVAQGLAFGINHTGGGRKQLYNVFKYADTDQFDATTAFAREIIGISSWREILR